MTAKHLVLAAGVLASLAACTPRQAPTGAEGQPTLASLEPVATTRQVMLGITIPTSDVVFQVGAAAPADDAGWEKVQANAAALAESGNLLLVGPRAVDQEDWARYSKALIAAAKVAEAAATARDVDQVLEAGNQIYETCDGCHQKYMAARAGEEVPPN